MKLTLPTDNAARKNIPLRSGCYAYFPAALMRVAMISKIGNDKHNPGEPLHHARGKSMDHADCVERHLSDIADMLAHRVVWTQEEQDALLTEAGYLCWRALALSQELHEKFGAPLAPAARLATDRQEALTRAILDQRPEWREAGKDHLGRRIRSYAERIHHPLCEKDDPHTGECGVELPIPVDSPVASESPCSDQPCVESRRIPAVDPRAGLPPRAGSVHLVDPYGLGLP